MTNLLEIASVRTNDDAAQEAVYAIDLPIVGADRAAFIALKLTAAAKEMSEIKKGMTPDRPRPARHEAPADAPGRRGRRSGLRNN